MVKGIHRVFMDSFLMCSGNKRSLLRFCFLGNLYFYKRETLLVGWMDDWLAGDVVRSFWCHYVFGKELRVTHFFATFHKKH